MTGRTLASVLALAALALAAAACGGGGDDDAAPANGANGEGAAQVIQLEADPGGALAYVQSELTTTAGETTIELTNDSSVPHDVQIEGTEAGTEVITEDTTSVTTTLEPGTYTYYCSVAGHREAGMEGTLTVE